jgi:hypothetical protein
MQLHALPSQDCYLDRVGLGGIGGILRTLRLTSGALVEILRLLLQPCRDGDPSAATIARC